jgi:hypothetical protein
MSGNDSGTVSVCKIRTFSLSPAVTRMSAQDRELMEGCDAQGKERWDDTQETAIEIE